MKVAPPDVLAAKVNVCPLTRPLNGSVPIRPDVYVPARESPFCVMATADMPVPFSVTTSNVQLPVKSTARRWAAAATEVVTAMSDAAATATRRDEERMSDSEW